MSHLLSKKTSIIFVLPALISLVLFNLMIFGIFLPKTRSIIIEQKKAMMQDLTLAAWSELSYYHKLETQGELPRQEAQQRAIKQIQNMRYGKRAKDYFWISDFTARMIMHPYRPELNGQDLSQFADLKGKKPFVEFARMVENHSEGLVEYFWQWQDQEEKLVPKLSFVKGFGPWGWIVGTGIYLDDVQLEIASITQDLLIMALIILFLIGLLLWFLVKRSIHSERQRSWALAELEQSQERYRILVDGGQEGMLLVRDGKILFANKNFLAMSGYDFNDLATTHLDQLFSNFAITLGPPKDQECLLTGRRGSTEKVWCLSNSFWEHQQQWTVITVRKLPPPLLEKSPELLVIAHTYLPIKAIMGPVATCQIETTVKEAIKIIIGQQTEEIIIQNHAIIGIVTLKDLIFRGSATGNIDSSLSISKIMTAPVLTIPETAMWFETQNLLIEHRRNVVVVVNAQDQAVGMVRSWDLLAQQSHPINILMAEIKTTPNWEKLTTTLVGLQTLVKLWLENGTKAQIIQQTISQLNDLLLQRALELSLVELGPAPTPFALVIFGALARSEQTLYSDQDHGIIFAEEGHQDYFLQLGESITRKLELVGHPRCGGLVMSNQSKWCKSQLAWQQYLHQCAKAELPQDLADINVFSDLRCIAGDAHLLQSLWSDFQTLIRHHSRFFFNLAQNILSTPLPLNFWGIELEKNKGSGQMFNIKAAILPLVGAVKLYALAEEITALNTYQRLGEMEQRGVLNKETGEELQKGLDFLNQLRLKHELECLALHRPIDFLLDFHQLPELEKTLLKKILADIALFRHRAQSFFLQRSG